MPDPQIDPYAGGTEGSTYMPGKGTITTRTLGPGNTRDTTAIPPVRQQGGQPSTAPNDPWAGVSFWDAGTQGPPPKTPQGQQPILLGMSPGASATAPSDPWDGLSFHDAGPQSEQPFNPMSQGEASGREFAKGITANWAPELAGLTASSPAGGVSRTGVGGNVVQGLLARGAESLGLTGTGDEFTKRGEAARKATLDAENRAEQQYPQTSFYSDLAGAIAMPMPAGKAKAAAEGVGEAAKVAAPWVQRLKQSSQAGGLYGGLSSAGQSTSEGQGVGQTAINTAIGTGLGSAAGAILSPAADAVGAGAKWIGGQIGSAARGIMADLGTKSASDVASVNLAKSLTEGKDVAQQEFAKRWGGGPMPKTSAARYGVPLGMADIGGEPTRLLARQASDLSASTRDKMEKFIQERLWTQAPRAQKVVTALLGKGIENAPALKARLEQEFRLQMRGAYGKLYGKYSKGIWSTEAERAARGEGTSLEFLSGAPEVQQAMRDAYKTWQSRVIADRGIGAPSPGIDVKNGLGAIVKSTANLDHPITPNMQFWDYVKREMDRQINKAKDGTADQQLVISLKNQLVNELDRLTNGEYAAVRQGAAAKFKARAIDADDMFEAGQQFVGHSGSIEPFRQALSKATDAEKELFAAGFASKLVHQLSRVPDNQSILNRVFLGARGHGNDLARQQIKLALGEQRARHLEAYLRVEGLVDRLRPAVLSGSQTARYLHKYGAEGGLAAGAIGGEMLNSNEPFLDEETDLPTSRVWLPALLLMGAGAKHAGTRFDEKVAEKLGDMLTSNDPAVLRRGIQIISSSKGIMGALRAAGDHFDEYIRMLGGPGGLAAKGTMTTVGLSVTPAIKNAIGVSP